MEKKLIPILIILLAALLFTSSCTGVYTTSLPVAVSPSPVPDVSPAPTATTSPRVTPSPSPSPTPTPPPYEGELIAQYALQFDGYRYNYGGQDPSTGFDCSGLVYYVFKQFGYRLNRVAADQALNGAEIRNQEDLLPGDIICFRRTFSPGTLSAFPGLQATILTTSGFTLARGSSSMRWTRQTTSSSPHWRNI